ncbi:hypothetical protein [Paralysiella testudinis]|uniref:Uncharacterized protein n=1 Tax=Paralysiella testudinis TaxID=2809020 RepID=A0A892ZGP1_9NEIS|nr:hypothetical protein [Paralysiella testudinis]QRQ82281.1 hypothetical protein JQU52_02370 [Paralysiella testudinis]
MAPPGGRQATQVKPACFYILEEINMEQVGRFSNKRFNGLIWFGLLGLALPLQAQPALSPSPTLAQNLVKLAQNDEFMDMGHVAAALQLPQLPDKAVWYGPIYQSSGARFSAVYDPPPGDEHITKVVFSWNPGYRSGGRDAPPQMFASLRIIFDEQHCPAVAPVAHASKQKPMPVVMPVSMHDPEQNTYTFYSFGFRRHDGQTNTNLYVDPGRCEITLSRVRDF